MKKKNFLLDKLSVIPIILASARKWNVFKLIFYRFVATNIFEHIIK